MDNPKMSRSSLFTLLFLLDGLINLEANLRVVILLCFLEQPPHENGVVNYIDDPTGRIRGSAI